MFRSYWVLCRKITVVVVMVMMEGFWTSVSGETQIIPLLSIAERYDSNVFLIGKTALNASNLTGEDYVTTVNPQVNMIHRSQLVTGNASIGVRAERYINNPGLSYVGFDGGAGLDFTQALQPFLPRARFIAQGSYTYTPQLPAFLGSEVAESGNFLVRGYQISRANTRTYSVGGQGSYELSPLTTLRAGYSYREAQFGSLVGPAALGNRITLFDTKNQAANIGVNYRLTRNDALGATYEHYYFKQDGFGEFRTHTMTSTWTRQWSQAWSTSLAGGGILIPGIQAEPGSGFGGSDATQIFPTGRVALTWQGISRPISEASLSGETVRPIPSPYAGILPGGTNRGGETNFTMSYSYTVTPSFFIAAGPAKSHVVGFSSSTGLTDRLTFIVGGNYSLNEVTGGAQFFRYEAVSGNAGVTFLLTSALRMRMDYSYSNFRTPGSSGQFVPGTFDFVRQTVSIALAYDFSTQGRLFRGSAGSDPADLGTGNTRTLPREDGLNR